MSTRNKWIAVIVVGAIAATLFRATGPLGGFWGLESGDTDPSGGALAALVLAEIVESVAFGVGLAWIAFGWPVVSRLNRPLAVPAFIAVAWGLISWAPHTSFHQSIGEGNWGGLAAVEWAFHVTLVVGAFLVAAFVWRVLQNSEATAAPTAAS
ncbi:MAG: hypothetical protein AAF531_03500 [Actinomycetota bacterium]